MARLIGIYHVALEVGDVEEAFAWYGRFFEFELRGRAGSGMAFVDMGDQFIALAAGVGVQASGSLNFSDPWGNHVQVVDYRDIQFTKALPVLRAMGIDRLPKTDAAREEPRHKGVSD